MKNNNGCICDKVYNKLIDQDIEKIRPYEFYYMIQNMKIDTSEIVDTISSVLLEYGLTDPQIKRISSHLSLKLRFTKADAKHIEKEMKNNGLITRKCNMIVIN
jgi:hypothetical protein